VGFFLAGLVTHGSLQEWWIEPLLGELKALPLYFTTMLLSTCNDNAAITYLTTLVPKFLNNHALQYAVITGALTCGGLTVIANAPNPAGQTILQKHFSGGVSPIRLLCGALLPTVIVAGCFLWRF
jgi:Na+/H+ antiporter NhaD/arsenite permease-like protein